MALTDGILAYWNLNNNGSGGVNLNDSTPNGVSLTANGAVTLGSGFLGNGSASFSGDGSSLKTNLSQWSSLSTFSVSLWFNQRSQISAYDGPLSINGPSAGLDTIISPPNFQLYSQSTGTFINGSSFPAVGSWNFLTITNDGSTINFYLNGTNIGNSSNNSDVLSAIQLGLDVAGSGSGYFNGLVDEVGVWNRALSVNDVTSLYNNGTGLPYPFLILYYNNSQSDGDWGNILNWWQDSGFTIQATSLPDSTTVVNIYGDVTKNTSGNGTCYCLNATIYSSNWGVSVTLNATNLVQLYGSSVFNGICVGNVTSVHDSSYISSSAVLEADLTLRNYATNLGHVLGNAYVYYDGGEGTYPIGGIVDGTVSYIGWSAKSPQWFNDQASGGGNDGDFNNLLNWWSDNTYTTRPINASGIQLIPDASTDVFISPISAITQNSGASNPIINSLTTAGGELSGITITISNGANFSNNSQVYNATIYGDVTFQTGAYNNHSIINGIANYESATSLDNSWTHNSLGNLNASAPYGSISFGVNISGGGGAAALGTNWISRLLHLPWFINV